MTETIIAVFEDLPSQLQSAARYVIDRPSDVALLSMREQARRAGVQAATMTRLAQRLGFEGYDAVRAVYADALRGHGGGFAEKAGAQAASQSIKGDHTLAADMLHAMARQIERLAEPRSLDQIVHVAKKLSEARQVYCLGFRSSFSIAWHLHYVLTLIGSRARILDGMAGLGADILCHASADDVLFVAGVQPYTRLAVEIAEYAHDKGIAVVAITDSEVSPLAQIAKHRIIVPTGSPSFFHAMSPGFAIAEVLAALVAGQGGASSLEALRGSDEQLKSFDTYLKPSKGRREVAPEIRTVL